MSMAKVMPMKIHSSRQPPFPVDSVPSMNSRCTRGMAIFMAEIRAISREISSSFPTYSPQRAMNFFKMSALPSQ